MSLIPVKNTFPFKIIREKSYFFHCIYRVYYFYNWDDINKINFYYAYFIESGTLYKNTKKINSYVDSLEKAKELILKDYNK